MSGVGGLALVLQAQEDLTGSDLALLGMQRARRAGWTPGGLLPRARLQEHPPHEPLDDPRQLF